ncbi:MAG TPA: adenylate/guanylate cyclase domain-containing protein [Spirochaetia bacterium]|nr:adenylate/guanylate cyclase domain-containing protein [Spirochaetales bacterium]HRZ88043.1 adenylate/guanylate cyclase domain-containing protein [Spirochaetia bacterium]
METRAVLPAACLAVLLTAACGVRGPVGQAPAEPPRAVRGQLDLSASKEGVVALDGPWAFWWGRFLDPPALAAGSEAAPDGFGEVPGAWNGYGIPEAVRQGHGTYRLTVRGLDPAVRYALRLSSFNTAARVFANGRVVHLQGMPGGSRDLEEPDWTAVVVPADPDSRGVLDIVLHVSNYADRTGGFVNRAFLGPYEVVDTLRDRERMTEVFLFGGILLMGFYYLALFFFRRKDRASLWFGFLCIVLAFRILCYDEYLIRELLPGLPWVWLFRAGYLTFSLAVFLIAAFLRSLFPASWWKPLSWVIYTGAAAYSLVVAVFPPLVSGNLLTAFQVFALASGAALFAVLLRALLSREPGAALLAGGFGCLFVSVVHDVLASQGILPGPFVVQVGLLFFLFAMSLVVTRKFAVSFETSERLAESLRRMNLSLERFVPREFLRYLNKSSLDEISLGDHSAQRMTVLFSDIRSFSRISERLSPEETFRFINSYLERVVPSIRSHGGFVDKYLGDGVMALFPQDADAAVRCAVDMQRRISSFNQEQAGKWLEPVSAGVGIHSGLLMLGTIGENERMDGTVISDAVNLASRLEGLTKEYEIGIAVSEEIVEALTDRSAWKTRYLGKIGVKGKREHVSVFEVYDGDPEDLIVRKDSIRGTFEEAIAAFYRQDFPSAMAGFRSVLEILPRDEASHYYIRMIRKMNLS